MSEQLAMRPILPPARLRRKWFQRRNRATFHEKVMPSWADRPHTAYLEIGVFEGASLRWMFEHVLTHPTSWAIGVDPWQPTGKLARKFGAEGAPQFMDECFENARYNLSPFAGRFQLIRQPSRAVLSPQSSAEQSAAVWIDNTSLDLVLIDGDHDSRAVLADAQGVLPLLKPGGWIIFDDYHNRVAKPHHVQEGYHWFLQRHGEEVEEIWQHRHMIAVRKTSG